METGIWLIVFLSWLAGYTTSNAAYFSDILVRQQAAKEKLGAYGGWKQEKRQMK